MLNCCHRVHQSQPDSVTRYTVDWQNVKQSTQGHKYFWSDGRLEKRKANNANESKGLFEKKTQGFVDLWEMMNYVHSTIEFLIKKLFQVYQLLLLQQSS